jgi:hypothetical protein
VNKSQLIDKIADGADISKAAAGRALDAFIDAVGEALKEVTRLLWLVSVLSPFASVQPVPAATRKLVRPSKSLPVKFLPSKPARP